MHTKDNGATGVEAKCLTALGGMQARRLQEELKVHKYLGNSNGHIPQVL